MQFNKKVHGSEEKKTAKCTLRLLPLSVLSKSFVSQIYNANIPPTPLGLWIEPNEFIFKQHTSQ
jgi:hypothetical protein